MSGLSHTVRGIVVGLAVAGAACGGSSGSATSHSDATVTDGGGGGHEAGKDVDHGMDASDGGGQGLVGDSAGGGGCACDGGLCIGSPPACCLAANVCGSACCSGSSVCLFGACVVPGAPCHTATDCPAGDYCDPALAPADAGTTVTKDAGTSPVPDGATFIPGPACGDPVPPAGRCVAKPPMCPADAGPPDGSSCIASCQYHPPPGNLSAQVKWQWGPTATAFPDSTDVWSTPTVARMYDTNCDGKIDDNDSPSIVFVSGSLPLSTNPMDGVVDCAATANGCKQGVLRMLNGRSGAEIWSLDKASPGSMGFDGNSIAIGDVDGDGTIDIVAITGEGYIVLISGTGVVLRTSTSPVPGAGGDAGVSFAWGGGLSIADLDADGSPEIIYGATVFSTANGAITLAWTGTGGTGGGIDAISTAADLDGNPNGHLELLAGNTAYNADGTILWQANGKDGGASVPDGYSAVADFDGDGKPEAVVVSGGNVWILNGATGAVLVGPFPLPGTGSGGPPTVADFDGDGHPEIGVAKATFYSVVKPTYNDAGGLSGLAALWSNPNHDYSSSVTGSTVFDFSGSGKPSVVYGDECYLWVFDGASGHVQFVTSHSSFTATESSLVADVDGDGHSEIVMVSNGMNPVHWKCIGQDGVGTTVNGATWTAGPASNQSYRGITVFGDTANSWVGTRTLWNEHAYHVTNICDDLDQACPAPNAYGSIPKGEIANWSLPWLNNFRQNVQGAGVFDAPYPAVDLAVPCAVPVVAQVDVRNIGQSGLPSAVNVAIFEKASPTDVQVGTTTTTIPLLPGQVQTLYVTLAASAPTSASYYAKIVIDPNHLTFHECSTAYNTSAVVKPVCLTGPK